jgi:hypothetical protein
MGRMPAADRKQCAMDQSNRIQGTVELPFEKFAEQKCKDALNIAAV